MGIDGDIALTEEIGPDIIKSGGMVAVLVGEEDGIKPVHRIGKHLLPEIGAAVDDDIGVLILHQHRHPKAFVFRIGTQAHRMGAPYYWDSLRGSGAEKADGQGQLFSDKTKDIFLFRLPFYYL